MKKSLLIQIFLLSFLIPAAAWGYNDLHTQALITTKEPDIVADTVMRTSRPGPVPILLAIRHSNMFPTVLKRVSIKVEPPDAAVPSEIAFDYDLKLKRPWWHEVRFLNIADNFKGKIAIYITFEITVKGKNKNIVTSNQAGAAGKPLEVLIGSPSLARFDGWYYGDSHFHTLFSDNAAEFGAPVDVSALMAETLGLDWMAFTDHSFDLDDTEDDSNINDPELPRWKRYLSEIQAARALHPELVLVTGEELSCGNSDSQNVHMLAMNPESFYVGNGDGYENGSKNAPDLSCIGVFGGMKPHEAYYAAHPIQILKDIEKKVINRGNWLPPDMTAPGLHGLQPWNGGHDPNPLGFNYWVEILAQGYKKFLLAGTDAHGDFNGIYVGWPVNRPYGMIRSAVYAPGGLSQESLVEGFQKGRIMVTNGPAALLEMVNGAGDTAIIGDTTAGGPFLALVYARSTPEYGPVSEMKIFIGDTDAKKESVLTSFSAAYAQNPMDMENSLQLPEQVRNGYVRLEVTSQKDGVTYRALTNPIWFSYDK